MSHVFAALRLGALCIVSVSLWGCVDSKLHSVRSRPDVVLITWDTTRADHVGPDAKIAGLTPNWTRLAEEGTHFTAARTTNPTTLPAHASLLTGQLPSSHGVRVNSFFELPESAETLAERLASAGWRTGAFVSAAVLDARFGLAQGFSIYDDQVGSSQGRNFGQRPADQTVETALHWLLQVPDTQSVFLWVHLFDPHAPWTPPGQWAARYAADPYRGEIAYADDQTGELLEGLRSEGRLDSALVLLTADHGEGLGEHGELHHGYFIYDSTMRVPLCLWAGENSGVTVPKGLRIDTPVLLSDLAPTVADLLGLSPIPGDGVSLAPLLRGESSSARELALESVEPFYTYGTAPLFGVVDERGDVWIDLPRRERYDLARDPEQLGNVYRSSMEPQADALFARHERAWPPTQPPVAPAPLHAEQLAALGYVTARTWHAAADAAEPRPDPKDLLPVASLWMGRHTHETPVSALAKAEKLVEEFGNLPVLAFFRADRLDELARPAEAISVLREASEANPQEPRLQNELRSVLDQRARDEALAQRIRATWEAHPDHPGAVHDLATVLHRLGALDQAEPLYRRWLVEHPDDDAARLELFRLLGARRAYDDALALIRDTAAASRRPVAFDCAEGRLLAWWMERPEEAKAPLRACREGGERLTSREIQLLE